MWDNESQRIGKLKCTPFGYALHSIADLLGFIGIILLLGTCIYLGYKGFMGTFTRQLLWLFVIPFGVGIFARILFEYSWVLALRKKFHYDYETRQANWVEDGKEITYKWKSEQIESPNSDTATAESE